VTREEDSSPRRRSLLFLARFAVLLVVFYFLVAWRPVNGAVIVPFTAGIARASAGTPAPPAAKLGAGDAAAS